MISFEWRSTSSFLVGQDGYVCKKKNCIIIDHLNALIITSWIVKVFNLLVIHLGLFVKVGIVI